MVRAVDLPHIFWNKSIHFHEKDKVQTETYRNIPIILYIARQTRRLGEGNRPHEFYNCYTVYTVVNIFWNKLTFLIFRTSAYDVPTTIYSASVQKSCSIAEKVISQRVRCCFSARSDPVCHTSQQVKQFFKSNTHCTGLETLLMWFFCSLFVSTSFVERNVQPWRRWSDTEITKSSSELVDSMTNHTHIWIYVYQYYTSSVLIVCLIKTKKKEQICANVFKCICTTAIA